MSNTYIKAAFTLLMSRDDAALLRTAQQAVDILDTNGDDADLAADYETLGELFHSVFPPEGPHRFGSFLRLFDDWRFPYLDAGIEIEDDPAEAQVKVTFSGDQFGVAQVAELIFQGCKRRCRAASPGPTTPTGCASASSGADASSLPKPE